MKHARRGNPDRSRRPGTLRWVPLLLLVPGLGALAWFGLGGRLARADIRNVLLISIDTCRADHLGCYGDPRGITPNIDALARESVLFTNALTPVPATLPAHASMLTGTNPPYHGVHDNHDHRLGDANVTLAELLKAKGFATGAVISAFVMDSRFGLSQGFDTYDDRFEEELNMTGIAERRGEEVSRHALSWLERRHREPFFLFLHYYDPHMLYDAPAPFRPAAEDRRSLYAGEVAYTDHCIGRVIDRLKALGVYDSTLIIVTADHGEGLYDHQEATHGYFIYNETVKVPLIFKVPGRNKPASFEAWAGLIDIVPTVCSLLDVSVPDEVQGWDLSSYLTGEGTRDEERYLYCETMLTTKYDFSPLLGIVGERWKYIQTAKPELYDLANDPRESVNLAEKKPGQARLLKEKLKRLVAEQHRVETTSGLEMDQESIERLASLGYVGDTRIEEDYAFDETKEDPKDFIDFHNAHILLVRLGREKRFDEARAVCLDLLRQRPGFASGHLNLGRIAMATGNPEEAVRRFTRALELTPHRADAHNDLGFAYNALGRPDEAIERFRRAIELMPDFFEAHNNLGSLLWARGDVEGAVDHFREALRIDPDQHEVHDNLGRALESQGKKDEAIMHFRRAVEIEPQDAKAHYYLGVALMERGKLGEAVGHYNEAVRINPDHADAHNNLGIVFGSQGKLDQAIQHFREVLRIHPDRSDALKNIEVALEKKNRLETGP